MKLIVLLIIAAALLYGTAQFAGMRIGERATGSYEGPSTTPQQRVIEAEKQAREAAEAARNAALRQAE